MPPLPRAPNHIPPSPPLLSLDSPSAIALSFLHPRPCHQHRSLPLSLAATLGRGGGSASRSVQLRVRRTEVREGVRRTKVREGAAWPPVWVDLVFAALAVLLAILVQGGLLLFLPFLRISVAASCTIWCRCLNLVLLRVLLHVVVVLLLLWVLAGRRLAADRPLCGWRARRSYVSQAAFGGSRRFPPVVSSDAGTERSSVLVKRQSEAERFVKESDMLSHLLHCPMELIDISGKFLLEAMFKKLDLHGPHNFTYA